MSSGASTPRSALTPPPNPSDGPSPLTVGTRFVKQYYQTLSAQPELITRFYQPTSVLSMGIGSEPSTTETTAASRFLPDPGQQLGFEFENGAIDAQMSVNNGVLLVVTGNVVYAGEEDDTVIRRQAFVHTFFLASLVSGTKRSYYIHNDVLRFLQQPETAIATGHDDENAGVEVTTPVEETVAPTTQEPPALVQTPSPPPQEEVVAPGGGVEETKEEVIAEMEEEEEAAAAAAAAAEETPVVVEEKPGDVPTETTTPSKPAKPNSWASLVASSATTNGTTSTPSTPSRSKATAAASPTKKATPPTEAAPAKPETNHNPKQRNANKRDPDCTLVIKNIDAQNTTEADVRAIFEPWAAAHQAKVIGCTVSAHRALAFVDYDTAQPVVMAVQRQAEQPFVLKEKTVEVYQKTLEYPKAQAKNRKEGGGRNAGRNARPYRRSGSAGGRGSGRSGR